MTDRQSPMNSNNIDSSTVINRDERHPLIIEDQQNITIDNNTINNIINSIIPTNNNNNNNEQQYLLPVDLLVSVDKSNKPTLRAAIPSSFAIQQQLPLQYTPLPPISPLLPTYPSYPTYPIYQTPSIPPIPPISQPVVTPQLSQLSQLSQQPQQSTLNPSAATFTPFTPFTAIEPILEQQQNAENQENEENTPWIDIDDKMEEKHDNDNNNDDEWCIFDDIEQQKQQQKTLQTVDSTSSKSPKYESISKQTTYSAPFKRKPRYFNHYGHGHNNTDNRQYDKNWRTHDKNLHISYKINRINRINKSERLLVEFVRHVTLPNRERYPQNTVLTKTWMMKNIGQIEWGYNVELVYCKGDKTLILYDRYPVINAKPGQEVQISATIKTSKVPGRYCTYFRLQKNAKFFGPRVWCDIIVANSNENVLDGRTNCGTQNNQNHHQEMDENDKPIKWKKKYGTKNEAYNHYKVVSCK